MSRNLETIQNIQRVPEIVSGTVDVQFNNNETELSSTNLQDAIQELDTVKATIESPTFTGTVSGVTKAMVGLSNVTNESKDTMFESPTFTGTVQGISKTMVGLSNVDNTSDLNKIISTATQTALDLKANRIDVDDLFTDASNLEYDDTFTDMRVADVQAALAHLGEESKYWSNIHSAVRLFGGIIQDNGDGTVRVANGGGLFKKEASSVEGVPAGECEPMQLNAAQGGKLFYENWEATENVQLTNNAYNYIFIVWDHTFDNGDGSFGKARVRASTNFYLQDWESEISYYNFKAAHPELTLPARRSGMLHGFTVGRVYKMDNEITIRVCGTNGWNFNKRVQLFGEEFFPVIRARGLDIQTIPNTLQFNVTEGVMWAEMANRFTVRAFEMDQGDTFTSWYQHTAETTALTLAQIQSTYPTGIANRKYDILYSSTDTKYYRLNPSNNTWQEVLDYINSKVNISAHPANLSALETLAPSGYVNNSQGTDYVVLQLQATDAFYRYNPNAALGNRWELFGDKSTVHPYVAVAFLGDVAGMNAEYPTGFNDVINVIVGCADGMYYEYSGVSGQSGWKRVQGYIERNGWLRFYKQSAVDALKYNDSTNNKLVDLENGMYGVAWIYMVHDNSCHVVYGQGAYTSEEAKQAALPSPLPGILAAYSTLVGKMTFSRGATTFENAESPFIEKFISSGVSLHNDLAGLDGGNSTQNRYYHLDESAYNLVNTFADVVDVSPEGDLDIVGDYSGANALFSGNLTVGSTVTAPTFSGALNGNATTATTATNVAWSGVTSKPTTLQSYGIVPEEMPSNINLDTKTTTALFSQSSNAEATTALNYPVALAGLLEVFAYSVMIHQRYWVYNSDDIYYRAKYNTGAWSAWVKGANVNDSITGNAATATTATNVAWSGITSKPTTVSGYGITDAITKDSNGNVGIGVTPSEWRSTDRVLEIGTVKGNSLWGYAGEFRMGQNYHFDGTWKYANNGGASQYEQAYNNHYWYVAPSGTAGSTISWTNAMRIAPSGNLLVGTSTDNGSDKLQVNGSIGASNFNRKIEVISVSDTSWTPLFSLANWGLASIGTVEILGTKGNFVCCVKFVFKGVHARTPIINNIGGSTQYSNVDIKVTSDNSGNSQLFAKAPQGSAGAVGLLITIESPIGITRTTNDLNYPNVATATI